MLVIARPSCAAYLPAMLGLISKLLMLMAVLLMPFGMAAASAGPVHHAPAVAAAGHCDEQDGQPAEQSRDQAIDCAMACSMVATEQSGVDEPSTIIELPSARPLAQHISARHPDIATPPPKRS